MTDQGKTKLKELIKLNEELENYFRNTIIPQLFVDSEMVLRKFTPPAMRQFNLVDGDLGRPIAEIHENFRFPSIIENIKQVIDTGELLEKEIQTTDMRWYQMNILPYIVQSTGSANGVIITFVEITLRILDLREQEKLIAEHELLLDTISHDIKTPLTSLGLTIELLKTIPEKGMDRFPSLVAKIDSGLRKMQVVINDLTESRERDYHYRAVEELLNFEHILEDVRLTLSTQIKESGAAIKLDIGISEILFVRRKLRSVVYNLVNNAIKYRSPDRRPEILIKTYREGEYIAITVSDNGIGIEKAHLGKIFTKYQRVASSVEGTGVGLYLVREVVSAAGGKISVESEPEKGSTFKVLVKSTD